MGGSLILYMISKNLPPAHWPRYADNSETSDFCLAYSPHAFSSTKLVDKIARQIINALSQNIVADQLAKEWDILPPPVRKRITAIANEVMMGFSHISNNVTKGIVYFNKLLGGRILVRDMGPSEVTLKIVDGRKVAVRTRINSAIAGAERAFGGFIRPPSYANMSKAERKSINRALAADRRAFKKRGR